MAQLVITDIDPTLDAGLARLLSIGIQDGFLMEQEGTGYSFNRISVTSTTAAGNTRGLRVQMTTSDDITHGDLQALHGVVELGSGVTLGTGAAVYPLSSWLTVPADITLGNGNVIAGLRVIVETNGVDLSAIPAGGESALIYAQMWGGDSGALDHGLRLIAGGPGSFLNMISLACTAAATVGTIFDMTEMPDGLQLLFSLGLTDAQSRHVLIYAGDSLTSAAVFAEVSVTAGLGSLYISTGGLLFVRGNNAGVAADWQACDTTEI